MITYAAKISEQTEQKINHLEEALTKAQVDLSLYSRLRLVSFIAAAIFAYYSFSNVLFAAPTLLSFIIFVVFLKRYQSKLTNKLNLQALLTVNQASLARQQRDWPNLPQRYSVTSTKTYWQDLNIAGERSFLAYVSAISSLLGVERLGQWLQQSAATAVIKERQTAQVFLAQQLTLRQELNAASNAVGDVTPLQTMSKWFASRSINVQAINVIRYGLRAWNVMGVAGIIGAALGIVNPFFVVIYIAGNLVLLAVHVKNIRATYFNTNVEVSKIQGLQKFSALVENIDAQGQPLPVMITGVIDQLTNSAAQNGNGEVRSTFSEELAQLQALIFYSELRFNAIGYAFMNLLFAWDVHIVKSMELWADRFNKSFEDNLSSLAEFEALALLATVTYENPGWCLPEISDNLSAPLVIQQGAHPLLPPEQVVANSIVLDDEHRFNVITGSHMSGKTTFLRTLGLNAVLAMAGGSVCAQAMTLPRVTVLTSMHVADSLMDGVSLFMAEALKIKQIVEFLQDPQAENNCKALFLLDEVLRGSNDLERKAVFIKLVEKLQAFNCFGLISTNDIFIAQSKEVAAIATYYHFQETLSNQPSSLAFEFDYTIRDGLVTKTNAMQIMQSMAIV